MACDAQHPRYRNTRCRRMVKCWGMPHHGNGPRGFWVEWDDETTKKMDFWEMINRLTNRAKLRQQQEDFARRRSS